MAAAALWRWVWLGLLSQPLLGLLWLLLLASQPFLRSLAPLPSSRSALEVALDWTFPAGLLGATVSLATLSRGGAFLSRLDTGTRFRGELGALLGATAYLQIPILLGARFAGAAPGELARALPAILTTDLHLAGIALLLLVPALSTALRASLLLSAAWFLPALGSTDEPLARVTLLFDAATALRTGSQAVPITLAPALALTLAAYLLRTGPARSASG
jgi:hypothetical protein